ncbi:MAG: TetR/AcrR family transcriptional regulator [Solirubrobacteraceae bacterium]|nr:TetR/AcrR family transcriptional regulator [Solirubrobacteraceae bacterium]
MPAIADLPPAKASEARDRLLATAGAIFYAEGINSVGVDRIVSEAQVTRATFYRHFAGKAELVLAYLQARHDFIAGRAATQAETLAGNDLLRAIADDIVHRINMDGFRGCEFINAASEFEDPQSPIHQAVARHRAWFFGLVRDAFVAAGHYDPEGAARHFVMLRDGAMVAGYLGDPVATGTTFREGVEHVIATKQAPNPGA